MRLQNDDLELKMDLKIFCDESGFTGNRLLDQKQPIFTYASVLSTDKDAEDFVNYIITKYKIQNGEIKSNNLLKSENGKKALDEIFEYLKDGRFKICICDKKYSIAGKFFEYIFEPPLASKNSIFYNLDFHRFITDGLHLSLFLEDKPAEVLFDEFYAVVKEGVETSTTNLFQPLSNKTHPLLDQIRIFSHYHKSSFINEMDGYLGIGSGKWLLDLTTTCVFSSLAQWSKNIDVLDVYCDDSKPLNANQEIFTSMVGRTDKKVQIHPNSNLEQPITFNLKQPITMTDSKVAHGIQLADAIAGIFNFAYKNIKNDDPYAKKWMQKIFDDESVLVTFLGGDFSHASLNTLEGKRNWYILNLLTDKSKEGLNLLDGIEQEILNIDQYLRFESKA